MHIEDYQCHEVERLLKHGVPHLELELVAELSKGLPVLHLGNPHAIDEDKLEREHRDHEIIADEECVYWR